MSQDTAFIFRLWNLQISKVLCLVALYYLTGILGLTLAVPPGYATIIWPPSGIAAGMLILYGWQVWPGIFLGSFIVNLQISGAFSSSEGLSFEHSLAPAVIALGSTAQALAGYLLVNRFIGLPLRFQNISQVCLLFLLVGPMACLVAATVGVSSLHFLAGVLPEEKIFSNFLTWWGGDIFGVFLFLPFMLMMPAGLRTLRWKGKAIGGLPAVAVLVLLMPLGLTLYAWKVAAENIYQQSLSDFETLAIESEKALLNRIDSYSSALLGGAGFFQGSEYVSPEEWQSYVRVIDLKKSFPGINGIGYIRPLKADEIKDYTVKMRENAGSNFAVHPETSDRPYYVITYLEPFEDNRKAIGLNIGFEDNRMKAANYARDTGETAITKRIDLVQDEEKAVSFLLLHPMYEVGKATNLPEERQKAFRGWIFAPIIAKNFLNDLTLSQQKSLNIRIYDGESEDEKNLIYNSNQSVNSQNIPQFKVQKKLNVMQQEWLVVWESTLSYEQTILNEGPLFILIGGLAFSGIFSVFLIVLAARNTETLEWMVEENKNLLPAIILLVGAICSVWLYQTIKAREIEYIHSIVEEEALRIEQLITFQTQERLRSLKRMAQRWITEKGTPYMHWAADATNHVNQIAGLKAVEWVDSTYQIRWVQPEKGNEKVIGMNILSTPERKKALMGAEQKDAMTITRPLDLVQGYRAFLAYAPLKFDEKFDGFIVGVFATDEFMKGIISKEVQGKFSVFAYFDGKEFFRNNTGDAQLYTKWITEKKIQVHDKEWIIKIYPTQSFIDPRLTSLPLIVLISSLLITALLALTARYILISKIKSTYLKNSEETFRTAMEYASIGMALVDLDGKWLRVNSALCDIVGYKADELLKSDFQNITHPDDLAGDMENIKKILKGEIKNYQMEKRYIRKNGSIIWVNLSVSLAHNPDGSSKYFISQIQDITQRMEVDRIKGEFISIVSHELRTPLTSIRGSLGLIEGTMSGELSDRARQLISIAYKNCERLIALINDILDIDKISAGKMRFDMKDENLSKLINSGIEANNSYAEKFKVSYVCDDIPQEYCVNVDAGRWQQVFSNLLSNAAKFSPENGNVYVSAILTDKKIRVTVRDEGDGISEEFRSRIFGKFSQADSALTRSKGGTGLGLSISKEIIIQMGGEIGFDTEIGKGTTFWFELPAVKAAPIAESVEDKKEPQISGTPSILHIENDEDFSKVLATALHAKAQLVTATTLSKAKDLIETQDFSLILLGIGMPDGSSLPFIEYLGDKADGAPPVVVLSTEEAPEEVRKNVAADLVKSRLSEDKMIEIILSHLQKEEKGKSK